MSDSGCETNLQAPSTAEQADDSLIADLRLALVSGVGPRTRESLLQYFGSAAEVFSAPAEKLRNVPGVGPKLCRAITAAKSEIDVDAMLQLCRAEGVSIVRRADPCYPRLLAEIADPPGVLFVRGHLAPQDALAIAIVGARHASHYGLQQAERLASGLARAGLTIVSGLARGIDAAAHRGALLAGGRTLAVLGSGVLNIYPPEHAELARDVQSQGAVISEAPPRSSPQSGAFPQRNRLITGMSLGVIVVEASERSGALISAAHAAEQGREVFAVPGRVDSRTSRGCHRLIRDGAKLVEGVDDVLEELGPLVEAAPSAEGRTVKHPAELTLNELEKAVLDAVDHDPTSIDDVSVRCGMPVHRVLSTISVLEMRRVIRRVGGNRVMRV